MTKQCKNCGAPVPDEARFCPECGKSVEPKAVCPHCGESLRTGDRFCIHCGHAVADGQVGTAHAPADAPRQEADHGVVYRKRCPECGTLVDETADQCGQCGYQFGRKSTGILDGRMRCPSCGQEIPDTARVCPECGCQLDRQGGRRGQGSMTAGSGPAAAEAEAFVGKHRYSLLVIFLLGIVAVALAVFLLARQHHPVQTEEGIEPMEEVVEPSGIDADDGVWNDVEEGDGDEGAADGEDEDA